MRTFKHFPESEFSKKLATHLYHMGAVRIEGDIHIFETSDTFRLTLERIPALSLLEGRAIPDTYTIEHAGGETTTFAKEVL